MAAVDAGHAEGLQAKLLQLGSQKCLGCSTAVQTHAKHPLAAAWTNNTDNIAVNHGNKGEHGQAKNSCRKKQVHFHLRCWSCLEWEMCTNRNCRIRTFEIQFGEQLGYISKYLMFKTFKCQSGRNRAQRGSLSCASTSRQNWTADLCEKLPECSSENILHVP